MRQSCDLILQMKLSPLEFLDLQGVHARVLCGFLELAFQRGVAALKFGDMRLD